MNDKTKFLDLLSQEINSGSNKFNFDSLNVYLIEAIKAFPDGNLKDVLLRETEENSKYLWSLLKASKKHTDSELIQFSIFNKDELEETLKSITKLESPKEQLFHLSKVALCFPSEDVFGLLFNAEVTMKANQSKLQIFINVTELCGRLTVGCNNLKVLHGLMHFFLRELGNVYEDLKSSDQPIESCLMKLKDAILGFLIHCHLKSKGHKENKCDDGSMTDLTEYRDLLAAILSLYIDVLMIINKRDNSFLDHVSNVVYIFLDGSPSHILDTVNQVSTLDEASAQMMLPFLRKVLHSTRRCCTGFINYIKYISAARKVLKLVDNPSNDVLVIKKIVNTVAPPDGLVTWISDKDDGVVKDLGLPGLTKKEITEHLLQFECDETIEELLDLVAVWETEERQGSKSTRDKDDDDKTGDDVDDTNLNDVFFVDSKGSAELLEQCQEQELTNTTSDRILKRQIDAMLEKLEATSEEEKDCIDLSFDEEEEQDGTFVFIEKDDEKMPDSLESSERDNSKLEDKADINIQLEDDGTYVFIKQDDEKMPDSLESSERGNSKLEDKSDISIQLEDILDESLSKSGHEKKRKRKSSTLATSTGRKTAGKKSSIVGAKRKT